LKKYILTLLFSISLFGNDIYRCVGYGKTRFEAVEDAKRSAIQQSRTEIETTFQNSASLKNGEAKQEISMNLKTSSNGVVSVELEIFSGKDDRDFKFDGVCRIAEAGEKSLQNIDQKSEEILKNAFREIENLEEISQKERKSLEFKILKLENDLSNLRNSANFDEVSEKIAYLKNDLENLPNIDEVQQSLLNQISTNFRVLNIKIEQISKSFKEELSVFQNSQNEKFRDFETSLGALYSDVSKLQSQISLLEKLQEYIFIILGFFGLIIIYLLFRRQKDEIHEIADISIRDKRVKIFSKKRKYKIGETLEIDFQHSFSSEMYIYIIDINNRDDTTFLFPTRIDNNRLLPNSKRHLERIEVVPPFGQDILKIIASPIPLEIPEIVYRGDSQVFADKRGFKNPNIGNIERDLANQTSVSDRDIIAHFRGQALKGGFQLFENFVELETSE
jgi:hypothetical protein